MATEEFIITLFCQVDDQMTDVSKRPDAKIRRLRLQPAPPRG